MTILIGLLLSVAGLLISVLSLSITTSVTGRLVLVIVGIAVSLAGIIGFVNRAYVKNAIWRTGR
jgi:hypothetical protein